MISTLSKYIPETASPAIADILIEHNVRFRITKPRASKLGDYRHPHGDKGHRISVNANLNPYHFLVTTLHELAHLICWNKYEGKVSPHGKEWKAIFRDLLRPYAGDGTFPKDVAKALNKYLHNPRAASCADPELSRVLNQYDKGDGLIYLDEIPMNAPFLLPPGRRFKKGPKLRRRYQCLSLDNNRTYAVSAIARVKPIEE